ncbi:hypothetical protein GGQ73_000568 [Rhizobium skierniewicense]|uniref:Uncharacterized protein n=1 Tax=Rhizobium skierniewicense TaxID=984260 RepID=A0A7W6G083_9HYPH|nr:hypothetical protein [Rhizobium skierniewicense]MBB3944643.1 hypothetical protein [Rhizobium skierniewicense]
MRRDPNVIPYDDATGPVDNRIRVKTEVVPDGDVAAIGVNDGASADMRSSAYLYGASSDEKLGSEVNVALGSELNLSPAQKTNNALSCPS